MPLSWRVVALPVARRQAPWPLKMSAIGLCRQAAADDIHGRDAIHHAVMESGVDGESTSGQAIYEDHLPKWAVAVQQSGMSLGHMVEKHIQSSRGWQAQMVDMIGDIECRIGLPIRLTKAVLYALIERRLGPVVNSAVRDPLLYIVRGCLLRQGKYLQATHMHGLVRALQMEKRAADWVDKRHAVRAMDL